MRQCHADRHAGRCLGRLRLQGRGRCRRCSDNSSGCRPSASSRYRRAGCFSDYRSWLLVHCFSFSWRAFCRLSIVTGSNRRYGLPNRRPRRFAAEAHPLLHGPGPARIQPNTRSRRELCVQLAGSPRFVPVCQDPLGTPALIQLDRRKPIQALTIRHVRERPALGQGLTELRAHRAEDRSIRCLQVPALERGCARVPVRTAMKCSPHGARHRNVPLS